MSSKELKKMLHKLDQDKKVRIFSGKESAKIMKRFNKRLAEIKLEYSKIEKESIKDASTTLLTA